MEIIDSKACESLVPRTSENHRKPVKLVFQTSENHSRPVKLVIRTSENHSRPVKLVFQTSENHLSPIKLVIQTSEKSQEMSKACDSPVPRSPGPAQHSREFLAIPSVLSLAGICWTQTTLPTKRRQQSC